MENSYAILDRKILQNSQLSFEARGVYAELECNTISLDRIPKKIIKELISIGYLQEVKE